ncbi:hypothetical protein MKEN_00677500 [Mycena kentingensis (nom. inval.)]|nr:hypothetical protein MKEN_00677500 [Mycena kentingensis (nom. inval.)]
MSHTSGTVTPRPTQASETQKMRDAIGAVNSSLSGIKSTFSTLNERSTELAATGPSVQELSREIAALRKQVREDGKRAAQDVQAPLRKFITADAFNSGDILEYIRSEIAVQVSREVDIQILEHIPVSLKTQQANNKAQLQDAGTSLTNSAARKRNAQIQIKNLDEMLATVLKTDGTRAQLYPADLRSLFGYSEEHVLALVRDFGLAEDARREVNLNRILGHVGECIAPRRPEVIVAAGVMFELVVL